MSFYGPAELIIEADHRARHVFLHRAFDELLADFLAQNSTAFPSSTTLLELLRWSNAQIAQPTKSEGHSLKSDIETIEDFIADELSTRKYYFLPGPTDDENLYIGEAQKALNAIRRVREYSGTEVG